ncbi:site-specific integrase [Clostridium sp. 19966]|uniref:site-specific integrase n=1 Tax=Clostridium sp. 19966 TaxID=2768166 RepID=UPI0028DF91D4|nr:site-specific integrase [Clostridium sp. 19966]MDT8717634.1 site-specific integrase [Clostridium sp. 19966]
MRGSIRKRGSYWEFTVDIEADELTGTRKRKSKSGFKTKVECQKALNALIYEIENGEYFEVENSTLKEYLNKWLDTYAKINVAPKTYESYKQIIEDYIFPKLGRISLEKLKPLHIQKFYTSCINELKLSGTTALYCHRILHSSLNQAVKWQLIKSNPTDRVDKPRKSKPELQVLDTDQLNLLLDNIKGLSLYMPVFLAATTGMRRGELCGLKWDNVDLENGIIYVRHQLQMIDGAKEIVPLKTAGSKRKVILLDSTIAELNKLNAIQEKNKNAYGDNYNDENFVLSHVDGTPYDPDYITRNFARHISSLSKELDIPKIRFHDLRHTHATLLLKAGANVKAVSERLGHTSVAMTLNTYSHLLPDMQKDAVTRLNSLLKCNN